MSHDAPVGAFFRSVALDLIPVVSVAFLILLTTIPVNLFNNVHIGGLWPLIGITFWTLARPRSMRMGIVFILGLLTDMLTFVPFGIHASVFVVANYVLISQRRFLLGQGFWMLWAAYAILATSVYAFLFLLSSVFAPGAISFAAGLIGVGMAWACVPLIVWLLSRLNEFIDLFDEPIA